MMKRTNSFTMIEIVLAMGVIVIGVISVLGLFPVGLNASRDAIAESYACESADQFLHLMEYGFRNDWSTQRSGIPDSKPAKGDLAYAGFESNIVKASTIMSGSGGTIHSTNNDGVYHLVTFRDDPAKGKPGEYDAGELTDFRGVMAVWQEDISLLDSDDPPDLTTPSNRDIGVALKLEVSWPANAPYDNRKKAVYHYELFNR